MQDIKAGFGCPTKKVRTSQIEQERYWKKTKTNQTNK